ncbi:hypothetical protein P692DRAFT_20134246 [Suillus brevipes Sb2]|nr:hypothetical protein P692DRAFT_20134246 [Suillus brevipes Sb2]
MHRRRRPARRLSSQSIFLPLVVRNISNCLHSLNQTSRSVCGAATMKPSSSNPGAESTRPICNWSSQNGNQFPFNPTRERLQTN